MQITHILLPIDGSSYSDHAIDYAVQLARLLEAKITAVCCYEWMGNLPEIPDSTAEELKKGIEKEALDILEKAAQILQEGGIDYTTRAIMGSPGKVVTNLAKSKEFGLIIMGSHGHSDIAGLFLGSVTHKVLNTIYCPVMVVP